MAPPSKLFTVIPDGDIDPDSPLTTGLFTKLRDNDIHLEEWLGLSFVAAQDHDHNGTNSALITAVAEGIVIFETAGSPTFNVPGSVDRVLVECWGAGAGGAGANAANDHGGGGGGGGYAIGYVTVTPGGTAAVTVGAGGAGGVAAANGVAGGASNFVSAATLQGGGGAGGSFGSSGAGGAGGTNVNSLANLGDGENGRPGGTGSSPNSGKGGDSGGRDARSFGGLGGASVSQGPSTNGLPGAQAGGGGSGAASAGVNVNGGAGADGMVIVRF